MIGLVLIGGVGFCWILLNEPKWITNHLSHWIWPWQK